MILISECKNGWDLQYLSEESQFYSLTSTSNAQTFNFNHIDLKNKKIALLIIGYSNTKTEIIETYQKIYSYVQSRLSNFGYDYVCGLVWPGFENRINYFCAVGKISQVKERLKTHLHFFKNAGAIIDIHAHSMGTRIVCETLIDPNLQKSTIRHFHCIAPAIEEKAFHSEHAYHIVAQKCEKIFVYHSENDSLLNYGFFFCEWKKALGSVKYVSDIQKVPNNILFFNCAAIITSHNAHKDTPLLFKLARYASLQKKLTCNQWEVDQQGEVSAIRECVEANNFEDEDEKESDYILPYMGAAALISGIVFMTIGLNK